MPVTAQTRVTGGQWRGRLLSTPREQLFRPTRAVVREALFNVLGAEVVGARVVDLFAGAGTVGFEALSRGADAVEFVDRDDRALAHVRSTAAMLQCVTRCHLARSDALRWVRAQPRALAAATVVFVDAPYRDDAVLEVLASLGQVPPPLVVCEHHRARALPDRIGKLAVVRRGRYGITELSYLRPAVVEDGTGE
ncbi:MAG: 16S rRNA (guanine(966)-N(2))-methyltransferase RsmD [Candidatus Dormibacteraeota bacterium]|nr:16S rRNA (guanine(966)-N(2))-methyltransferase RsmD [Candidatus Dormibacteraeota bacterium]